MGKDQAKTLLEALSSGYNLPTLSPVAMQLIERAADDACSAQDIAALVKQDPSLAVRVLKMANSVFFQAWSPVSTLTQAVVQLGFQRLRIMALSISLRDTFPMGKVGGMDYERFWRISFYRGLIATHLAARDRTWNAEEAFVAGLIREVGLLIFFDLFVKGKEEKTEINTDDCELLLGWERTKYGIDHRQVGEAALKYWRFPEHMILCQRSWPQEKHPLVRLCEAASLLSGMLSESPQALHTHYEEAERLFGIQGAVVSETLVRVFEKVEAVSSEMQVRMNKEKDLLGIVEKANLTLSRISAKFAEGPPGKKGLPAFGSLGEGQEDNTNRVLQAVAHEIRNPLMAVGGFARKLAGSVDPRSESGKYISIILTEAARLEKVLSHMTSEDGTK
jgi:HD-like signal output (HDOD) protein